MDSRLRRLRQPIAPRSCFSPAVRADGRRHAVKRRAVTRGETTAKCQNAGRRRQTSVLGQGTRGRVRCFDSKVWRFLYRRLFGRLFGLATCGAGTFRHSLSVALAFCPQSQVGFCHPRARRKRARDWRCSSLGRKERGSRSKRVWATGDALAMTTKAELSVSAGTALISSRAGQRLRVQLLFSLQTAARRRKERRDDCSLA